MEYVTVFCASCEKPLTIWKGKRNHYRRFCGDACREKFRNDSANANWIKKPPPKKKSNSKKYVHPWMKRFELMILFQILIDNLLK